MELAKKKAKTEKLFYILYLFISDNFQALDAYWPK